MGLEQVCTSQHEGKCVLVNFPVPAQEVLCCVECLLIRRGFAAVIDRLHGVLIKNRCLYGVPVSEVCLYGAPVSEVCLHGVSVSEVCLYGMTVSEVCWYGVSVSEMCL